MSKLQNNPLDLKEQLLKTKNNDFNFNIEEEIKKTPIEPRTEKKETKTTRKEQETKKAKTYKFYPKLIEDIEKIVYMDRELKGNETTLVTKALEKYVYSKENKELIRQYDELKGINKNE